jgi:hypothetical protein
VICCDNQFSEVARVPALRGAEVLMVPDTGRFELGDDTPESEAPARCYSQDFLTNYAPRAAIPRTSLCWQARLAGYVDLWTRDGEDQPHHAGAALS